MAPPSNIFHFGPYELRVRARELYKNGTKLRLRPQPFRVLQALVEQGGGIVTRDELRKLLWPGQTFVDFEHGLNNSIKELRAVLSDSADKPRYIETLPKLGYRVLVPVECEYPRRRAEDKVQQREDTAIEFGAAPTPASSTGSGPFGAGRSKHAESSGHGAEEEQRSPDLTGTESDRTIRRQEKASWVEVPPRHEQRGTRQALRRWAVPAAIALIAIAALTAYVRWSRANRLSERDIVVISDFNNSTGDAVFDEAMKQALSVELSQSPYFTVASDLKIAETLRRMGRPPSERLTLENARDVCLRLGGKAILAGSISSLGNHYIVGLEALGCASGSVLAAGKAEAANKESVLKALDHAASQVRGKMGESIPSLQKYDFPLDTTTKSLEALKAFSMGLKAMRESGDGESIPFFSQAVQLDPEFALAYVTLGRAYEDVGEDNEAVKDFIKAYELRDRLSEREKLYIATLYNETVTGDVVKAVHAGELWTEAYPRDGIAREKLGTIYGEIGQVEKASAQFEVALKLDPDSSINVSNAVMVTVARGRAEDAERMLEAARARGLDGPVIRQCAYAIAFQRNDTAEMERQIAWAAGKTNFEDTLLSLESDTEAYYGRFRQAHDLSERAIAAATRDRAGESAALEEIAAGLRDVEVGDLSSATSNARRALAIFPSRNIKILAALALARGGNPAIARALVMELEQGNPENTLIRFYWLPTIKASLELRSGKAAAAILLLRDAVPYELAEASNVTNIPNLYSAYVRGQAYLAENDAKAAAKEFEKFLHYRGIVQNSILGALAELQLARTAMMIGDLDAARKRYLSFLFLWNDADPDIPIFKQAKIEYARLK